MDKSLEFIKHIHLIAICGTGMGSLAGLLKEKGYHVTGSDQNIYPPMSDQLAALGVPLFSGYKPDNLKNKPDLIIVGNAVSKNNPEVVAMLEQKIPYLSMPQALSQLFIEGKESIVVAGTHGKTTTSALLSHLLRELKSDPSYLVGGVFQEDQKNYHEGNGPYFVIEGDEYDTAFFDKGPKFLHYQPFYTIITSLEFDHADIYRDINHLSQSFEQLIEKINPKGMLLACNHYPQLNSIINKSKVPVETYGLLDSSDWQAQNMTYYVGATAFDIFFNGRRECRLQINMVGEHNVLNVLVTCALLKKMRFNNSDIQKALLTFKGIKRRQEIRGTIGDIIVMDDFAHHPTAVNQTIDAVKKSYPNHTLWAIFEPRSNTSKRALFQKQFSESFDKADYVILADVFMPEKIKDGKILDVDDLAQEISSKGVPAQHISGVDTIVDALADQVKPPAVILIMSNGGFGGIHGKVIEKMQNR